MGECTALRELPNSLIKEVSLDGIMKDTEEINSLKGFFFYMKALRKLCLCEVCAVSLFSHRGDACRAGE